MYGRNQDLSLYVCRGDVCNRVNLGNLLGGRRNLNTKENYNSQDPQGIKTQGSLVFSGENELKLSYVPANFFGGTAQVSGDLVNGTGSILSVNVLARGFDGIFKEVLNNVKISPDDGSLALNINYDSSTLVDFYSGDFYGGTIMLRSRTDSSTLARRVEAVEFIVKIL